MLTLAEGTDWTAFVQQGGVACAVLVVLTGCVIAFIKVFTPLVERVNEGLNALRDSSANNVTLQQGHERALQTVERTTHAQGENIAALGVMQTRAHDLVVRLEKMHERAKHQ